ncbi:ABC transporter permease [Cryobacterium cheniae]|uniref:ABC transporter permease n=1 Tax=Cryobacterium cheniae TaxID=1259262 RepID=A0A4R8XMT3_9MICO|nr:ABC transporter permease [Cryobacterium cheniae]
MPIFGKILTDGWRSLIGWAIGLAAPIFLYLPTYPSMAGPEMQKLLDTMPTQLLRALNYDQITSGAGYTQSTVFGLIGFLLISIAGVSWGAAALGGDEESGHLELTLAHGVTRLEVVVQRFAALSVRILALSAEAFLLILLLNEPYGLGLNAGYLLQTSLLFGGFALLCASVAMLAGAMTGRRVWGVGAGALVAAVGYVFNAVGNQSADLEWLHAFSPYYWAYGNNPLQNGGGSGALLAFYGGSLAVLLLTTVVFRRRDIGV